MSTECFNLHTNKYEPLRETKKEAVFLSHIERRFSTEFAKAFCKYVYGKQLNPKTWGNWRKWVGISGKKRTCDYDQLCKLVAIAKLRLGDRLSGRNYFPELTQDDIDFIKKEIDTIEFHQEMSAGIQFLDQNNLLMGSDIPNYLGVTMRDLLRKVPGFNAAKVYRLDDIKFYLS